MMKRKQVKIIGLLTLLLTLLITSEASAHVKWVIDVNEVQNTPKDMLFTQFTMLNVTLGLVTLIIIGGLVALSVYLKRNQNVQAKISQIMNLRPYVSTVLSIALGISLIASGLGHSMFAPELALDHHFGWLAPVQTTLGVFLIAGLFTRISAALTLLLYVLGIFMYQGGMIDYIELIGVCIYLIITGRKAFGLDNMIAMYFASANADMFSKFDKYAMGILRITTGITLIWLGVDKWWHPHWVYAVIDSYNLPLWGFSKEMYAFGAGLVETAVGIGVLAGTVNRIIAVVLALLFSVTAMVFQGEIIGHIVLFGIVFAMLIEGAGTWEIANLFKARVSLPTHQQLGLAGKS